MSISLLESHGAEKNKILHYLIAHFKAIEAPRKLRNDLFFSINKKIENISSRKRLVTISNQENKAKSEVKKLLEELETLNNIVNDDKLIAKELNKSSFHDISLDELERWQKQCINRSVAILNTIKDLVPVLMDFDKKLASFESKLNQESALTENDLESETATSPEQAPWSTRSGELSDNKDDFETKNVGDQKDKKDKLDSKYSHDLSASPSAISISKTQPISSIDSTRPKAPSRTAPSAPSNFSALAGTTTIGSAKLDKKTTSEEWLTAENVAKTRAKLQELYVNGEFYDENVIKMLDKNWESYNKLTDESEREKRKNILENILLKPGWGIVDPHPGDDFTPISDEDLKARMEKAEKSIADAGLVGEGIRKVATEIIDSFEFVESRRVVSSMHINKQIPRSKRGRISAFCIDGPPGTGKTTLGEQLARALDMGFYHMPLSGESDPALLLGYRAQWATPAPGVIVKAQIQTGRERVVIMLDEAEKAKKRLTKSLGELLETNQPAYTDAYFQTKINKQDALFILTTNQFDLLPTHVKDRVVKLYLPGYSDAEKAEILNRDYTKLVAHFESVKFKFITSERINKDKPIYEFHPDPKEDVIKFMVENYIATDGMRIAKELLSRLVNKAYKKRGSANSPVIIDTNFVRECFGEPNPNIKRIKEKKKILDKHYPDLYRFYNSLTDDVEGDLTDASKKQMAANLDGYEHHQVILIKAQKAVIRSLKRLEPNEAILEQIALHEKKLKELEYPDDTILEARRILSRNMKPYEIPPLVTHEIEKKKEMKLREDKDEAEEEAEEDRGLDTDDNNESDAKDRSAQKGLKVKTSEPDSDDLETPKDKDMLLRFRSHDSKRSSDRFKPAKKPKLGIGEDSTPKLGIGGGSWLNLFKGRVAKKIADPSVNLKLTVTSSTVISSEIFDQACNEIGNDIAKIQEEFKTSTDVFPENEALFEGLKMEKLSQDEFRMVREGSIPNEEPKDILHIVHSGKLLEVIASDFEPLGDEKFAMVLAAKKLAEASGRKGFKIKNCEERPQDALLFYLIGKSLGLNPTFEDGPGQKGETEKALRESSFGDLTVKTNKGEEITVRDLFDEVRGMKIREGDVESIKLIKDYISAIKILEEDEPRFRM